jgi:hypothetical protein
MKTTTTPKQNKKCKALYNAVEPYSFLWNEWIISGACFLNHKEITVIENYLHQSSHYDAAKKLNITTGTAANILNKGMLRLKWNYKKFQGWQTEKLLEEHGIITYTSEQDRFLNAPYQYISISYNLKIHLGFTNGETMQAILDNYSEAYLKRCCMFSPLLMKELKDELKRNNILHLLKKGK